MAAAAEEFMRGTKQTDVCRAGSGAAANTPTGVHGVAAQLRDAFAGARRPDAVLAHSHHIAHLRHLWVLTYINGTNDQYDPKPTTTASGAILGLARAVAHRRVHDLRPADIDAMCLGLKAEPATLKAAGVMYVCNMLWAAIFWRESPPVSPPPSDLKILDLFHLDSLRRAAQVPELRAAALTVFAHPFDLRPGERVLGQYQVPTSSATLSTLQVLEFVRPAPYVVGLANTITFADASAILRDPQAMEALVFGMFRARARSLVDGFEFSDCVWAASEMETRAGPEAARRVARVKPVIVRWDVNRYHVCDNRGEFTACATPQQAVSMWRRVLRTRYGDVVDNRMSFSGLLG